MKNLEHTFMSIVTLARFPVAIHSAFTMLIKIQSVAMLAIAGIFAVSSVMAQSLPKRVLTTIGHKEQIRFNGDAGCAIEVVQDTNYVSGEFAEDWLSFLILDKSGRVLVSKNFHSTYQEFRVDALDIDNDGKYEFVFKTGEGRGTSVRKEVLSVERVQSRRMHPVVMLPVSAYYDSGKQWWYDVTFRSTNGIVSGIELKLNADGPEGFENAPAERLITLKWSSDPLRVRLNNQFFDWA